jgi:TIR domain
MSGIFISYRREDAAGHAGRLYERLSKFFDEDHLFMDLRIPPGEDFVDRIEQGVGSCEVLLAVIGNDWVTVTNADGQRRLEDPQDYTRLEVEAALQRGVRVIPVLVGGAKPPIGKDLPEGLARLARLQAHEVTDLRWDFDTQKLVEAIENVTEGRIPGPNTRGWQDPQWQAPRAAFAEPAPPPPRQESPPRAEAPRQEPSWQQAPPPPPYVPPPEPPARERVKPFVTWGWITGTIGSILIPFLALVAIVLGILVIVRSEGTRTGTGIAIIVVSILCGLFGVGFWAGLSGG